MSSNSGALYFMHKILGLWAVAWLGLACRLAGEELGQCQQSAVLSSESFCRDMVASEICTPLPSKVWSEYSTTWFRDQQIEDIFMFYIQDRLLSEYIYKNGSFILSNNQVCYDAYRRFLCWFNFPQCDAATKQSLPVCKSVCMDFFEKCLSSQDACDIIYTKIQPGLNADC